MSSLTSSEEGNEEDEISEKKKEAEESKAEPDSKAFPHTQSTRVFLLATDLHLELDIIHHRASLKLLQLNAGQTHCHTDNFTHRWFWVCTQFYIDKNDGIS